MAIFLTALGLLILCGVATGDETVLGNTIEFDDIRVSDVDAN